VSDSIDVGRLPDEFVHAVGGLVVESSVLTEAIHVPTRPLRHVSSSCDVETSSGKKRGRRLSDAEANSGLKCSTRSRGLNDVHVWGHGAHALVVSIFGWIEEGATLPLSATLLSCLIEEELAASASPCDAAASTLLAVMSPSASLLSSSEGMMSPSAFLPRWR
jgi:hypothetical protein